LICRSKKYGICTVAKLIARRIFTKSFKKSKNLLNSQHPAQKCKKLFWLPWSFRVQTSELHISQAFWEHQARQIPTPYKLIVKFCSKWVLSSLILHFLSSSYMRPFGWNSARTKGRKKFVLPIESWFSIFFHFLFSSCYFIMSPSIWPLQPECEVFYFFQ
jgi:hypothetical protein